MYARMIYFNFYFYHTHMITIPTLLGNIVLEPILKYHIYLTKIEVRYIYIYIYILLLETITFKDKSNMASIP